MRRFGFPILLALLTATAGNGEDKPETKKEGDEDKGKLVIRWHGQSFFEITTSKGTKIVIDPHALEQYRMNLRDKENPIEAELILITHPHTDHSQIQVIKDSKDEKKVKQIWAVDKNTKDWNSVKEEFKDVRIQSINLFHDNANGMMRGKNGAFVLDVDGLRIVHLGDLGHSLTPAQLRRIGTVDILMVPIGGIYTINGLVAADVIAQVNPKRYAIPMHYGTIVYDYLLDLKKSGFIDNYERNQIQELKTNKFVIDPKAAPPKEMKILIPHFFEDKKSD